MTETYSLASTGRRADEAGFAVNTVQIPDSAGPTGHSYTQQTGAQILCKNPDGSQSWYTIDAERSIPGVSLVMIAV